MRSSPSRLLDEALAPAPDPERIAWLKAQPFAHRGLHGEGRVENSRAAFLAAVARGHGIELDVQLSRDGQAMVFHDDRLERLAQGEGPIGSFASDALLRIRLKGSEETIPTLPGVLELIGSRVPLLVELKAPNRNVARLCLAVCKALDGYRGPVAAMSFNPDVGRWFARHGPRVTRGLVVTENGRRNLRGWGERHLSLWRSKPDFLAYDIRDLPSRFASAQRSRGLPVLTWTVRDEAHRRTAAVHADQIISEA